MNYIFITGRLGKKPELKILPSGKTVANFTVAVARAYKDTNGNKLVDWCNIVCWGATAEACGKYLDKGDRVAISGRFQERTYDKKDGTKGHISEVVANEVEFLSEPKKKEAPHEDTFEPGEGWVETDDGDDMPF